MTIMKFDKFDEFQPVPTSAYPALSGGFITIGSTNGFTFTGDGTMTFSGNLVSDANLTYQKTLTLETSIDQGTMDLLTGKQTDV